jgi:NAD(P)H-flavin reductase
METYGEKCVGNIGDICCHKFVLIKGDWKLIVCGAYGINMIKPETKEVKELLSTHEEKIYTGITYANDCIYISDLDGSVIKFTFHVC